MNENKQTNNSKYASAATSSRTTHPKPQPNKIKILYEKATDPTQNKSVRNFYQSAIGDGRHLVQQQLHYCYCFSTTTYLICISSSNKNYKNQARTKAFSTCTHSSQLPPATSNAGKRTNKNITNDGHRQLSNEPQYHTISSTIH